MRPGEVEGVDYFFVSKEQFESWMASGQLLEHALVYGEYKGIPRQQVDAALQRGCDVVLRIDVQVGELCIGGQLFASVAGGGGGGGRGEGGDLWQWGEAALADLQVGGFWDGGDLFKGRESFCVGLGWEGKGGGGWGWGVGVSHGSRRMWGGWMGGGEEGVRSHGSRWTQHCSGGAMLCCPLTCR